MRGVYTLTGPLLSFRVLGDPVPEGQVRNLGKGRPSIYSNQDTLLPFRNKVQFAAEKAIALREQVMPEVTWPLEPAIGAGVACHFTIHKALHPSKHLKALPTKQPDIDKLVRTIHDALKSAGVYVDDRQVVWSMATKVYPNEEWFSLNVPGVVVMVYTVSLLVDSTMEESPPLMIEEAA